MTFPTAGSTVYYNEEGEVLGWDSTYYDEPSYDPDDHFEYDYAETPEFDTVEECLESGLHGQDGSGTDVSGVYTCDYCGAEYGEPDGEDD